MVFRGTYTRTEILADMCYEYHEWDDREELGAAMAQIAQFDFGSGQGFGYGSPWVGDDNFRIMMQPLDFTSYINQADAYTAVGLSVMINMRNISKPFVFQHAGKLVTFTANYGSLNANHDVGAYQAIMRGK